MTMRRVGLATGVALGTPIPGACSISDAWVTVQGDSTRVNEIAVGTKFDIYCTFSAINQGGGYWSVCITAIGIGAPTVQNYRVRDSGWTGGTTIALTGEKIDSLGDNVMPNGTGVLQIRLKMWMKDTRVGSGDFPSDVSKW